MSKSKHINCRVSEAQFEYLEKIGGGSISEGIRVLLNAGMGTSAPAKEKVAVRSRARPAPVATEKKAVQAPAPAARYIGKRR